MGKQYNKAEKRRRRLSYLKRKHKTAPGAKRAQAPSRAEQATAA